MKNDVLVALVLTAAVTKRSVGTQRRQTGMGQAECPRRNWLVPDFACWRERTLYVVSRLREMVTVLALNLVVAKRFGKASEAKAEERPSEQAVEPRKQRKGTKQECRRLNNLKIIT